MFKKKKDTRLDCDIGSPIIVDESLIEVKDTKDLTSERSSIFKMVPSHIVQFYRDNPNQLTKKLFFNHQSYFTNGSIDFNFNYDASKSHIHIPITFKHLVVLCQRELGIIEGFPKVCGEELFIKSEIRKWILSKRGTLKESTLRVICDIIRKLTYFSMAIFLINDGAEGVLTPIPSSYFNIKLFFFCRGSQISFSTLVSQLQCIKNIMAAEDTGSDGHRVREFYKKEYSMYTHIANPACPKFGSVKKNSVCLWTMISTLKFLYCNIEAFRYKVEYKKELIKYCVYVLYLFLGMTYFCRWSDMRNLTLSDVLDLCLGKPFLLDSKCRAEKLIGEDGQVTYDNYKIRMPHLMGLPNSILHLLGLSIYRSSLRENLVERDGGIGSILRASKKCQQKEIRKHNRQIKINVGIDFGLPPPPQTIITPDVFVPNIGKLINAYYDCDVINYLRDTILNNDTPPLKLSESFIHEKGYIYYPQKETTTDSSSPPSPFVCQMWKHSKFNDIFILVDSGKRIVNLGDIALSAIHLLYTHCEMDLAQSPFSKTSRPLEPLIRNMVLCNYVNYGVGDYDAFRNKSLVEKINIAKTHIHPNVHTLSHLARVTGFSYVVSALLEVATTYMKGKNNNNIAPNIVLESMKKLGSIHLNHSNLKSTLCYYNKNCQSQSVRFRAPLQLFTNTTFISAKDMIQNCISNIHLSENKVDCDYNKSTQLYLNRQFWSVRLVNNRQHSFPEDTHWGGMSDESVDQTLDENNQLRKVCNYRLNNTCGGFWEMGFTTKAIKCTNKYFIPHFIIKVAGDDEKESPPSNLVKQLGITNVALAQKFTENHMVIKSPDSSIVVK